MTRKKLTIGLFGFGCVGKGLYDVLEKTPGLKTNIKKICVKDQLKSRPIPIEHFTFDKSDVLNDPEINVIVELIDDADAAFEIVSEALKKGIAVVTANKKMIAEHFTELLELQKTYNAPLLYEAACCASIPIIRNLEEYYDTDLLESVEGIVNGSTNYILTKTFEENISYEEALGQAQEKGYAESNPILDTGGFDAKYKLLILLAHSFGIIVKPEEIFNLGIDRIGNLELKYAKEKGFKIKLVAQAYRNEEGKITAFVFPKFIHSNEKLFSVDDVYNGVQTKTSFADTQFFVGKGAGAYPTASAVLSDLSALTYDYRYEYKKFHQNNELQLSELVTLKILLRHKKSAAEELKLKFIDVEEIYLNGEAGYMIGRMELSDIKEIVGQAHGKNSFVLFE
jgi:homoserine dehydrogenase